MAAPDDECYDGHVTRIAKSGSNDHLFRVDVNGEPETKQGEQFSSIRSRFAYEPKWPSFVQIIP
jgi:hypothetical protein